MTFTTNQDSKPIHGIFGTMLFHAALILLLLYFKLPSNEVLSTSGGGVEVNFGNGDTGLGAEEPAPADQSKEELVEISASPVASDMSSPTEQQPDEKVFTQDFDKTAPSVAEKKEKPIKKTTTPHPVVVPQKSPEQIAKEKQDAENQRKLDDQNRAIDAKNALAGKLFGKGTGTGSQGIASGTGNQGRLDGVAGAPNYSGTNGTGGGTGGGNGNGNGGKNYSLSGRSAVSFPQPEHKQAAGKVVVEILVDRNGKVIDARPGVKGTTTSNQMLYDAAKDAAMKANFNASDNAPERQKGYITYVFELQ